jgi:hypothetical protein
VEGAGATGFEEADWPMGISDDEFVFLKLGMVFLGIVDGAEGAKAGTGPEPEPDAVPLTGGFELAFFFADNNNSSRFRTAFSISSFFDKSTPSATALWARLCRDGVCVEKKIAWLTLLFRYFKTLLSQCTETWWPQNLDSRLSPQNDLDTLVDILHSGAR